MTPPYATDGPTAVIGAIIVCVVLLCALAYALCRAAADGDRLWEPLDETAETFSTDVIDATAMPLSDSPVAQAIREQMFANRVERWLREEAS